MSQPFVLSAAAAREYPYKGNFFDVNGGRMHVLDEGPVDGSPLVCVHGNPTWSFYYRRVVERFSPEYRVVVPDHIGCGFSDKPQDWPYQLADHVNNLVQVIEDLDLQDITLMVHDWGGAIGMGAATRMPERFKRFVVTNTAAFRSLAIPPSIATCRIPVFGSLAVRGFNGFSRVATIRAASRPLPQAAKDGLTAPYNSWANRIATLRFVEDIPLKASHPSYAELHRIEDGLAGLRDRPMMLCWGEDDFCFTPKFREEWQQRFPEARVHAWDGVGHYVLEDAPQRTLAAMERFFAANPLHAETVTGAGEE